MSNEIAVEISQRAYDDRQKGRLTTLHRFQFSSIEDAQLAIEIARIISDRAQLFTLKQPHELQIKIGLNQTYFINAFTQQDLKK